MFSEFWRSLRGGGDGGKSKRQKTTTGIDRLGDVRIPSSVAPPRQQRQHQHRRLASTLAARVVSALTPAQSMDHDTNNQGGENGVDGGTIGDDRGPDLETLLARPPPPAPPPPRWPPGGPAYGTRLAIPDAPKIRAPLLGGDIFGPSRPSTAAVGTTKTNTHSSAMNNNNNNKGRTFRRVHGPSAVGRPASGRARVVGGGAAAGTTGGTVGDSTFVPPARAPLASERAARLVAPPPSSLCPWENAGRFAARPRAVLNAASGGARVGGGNVSPLAPPPPAPPAPPAPADRLITRDEAFAQGMRGGGNGGGGRGGDHRPNLERLRRIAEMSLDGGGGGNDDGEERPIDPIAEAEALAAEKAAYAARIAAEGAAARQRAGEQLAAMRELLDRVNLSSSSAGPPSSSISLPPLRALPPAPSTSRPAFAPWEGADSAFLSEAATAEEVRLRSQQRAAGDARRLLLARAQARANAERESSAAAIAEAEKEVRAAKGAVGRAAARAERAANTEAERRKKKQEEEEEEKAAAKAAVSAAAVAAAAAADDEILILSDSDDDEETKPKKPAAKPNPPVGDDEVLLLSSSDDDEQEQQREREQDLSSALESGLALEDEDDEDEESTTVDLASLAAAAAAADLPASAGPALAPLKRVQRNAALAALTAPGRRLPGGGVASADDVVAFHPRTKVPLLRSKARSLVGRSWLNDEVMNMANDCMQDFVIKNLKKREEEEEEGGEEGEDEGKEGKEADDGNNNDNKTEKKPHHPPRTHYFSSFFLTKLMSPGENGERYNYAGVRRWTAPPRLGAIYSPKPPTAKQAAEAAAAVAAARAAAGIKSSSSSSSSSSSLNPVRLKKPPKCILIDCDLLVFLIHLGVHWACCVVDLNAHVINYFDSMAGEPREHIEAIQRWLRDEAEDKLATVFADVEPKPFAVSDFENWPINYLDASEVPQQGNGSDCGVFTLRFAANAGQGLLSAGGPGPDFSQRDMDTLRLLVAADMVLGTASATPRRRRG